MALTQEQTDPNPHNHYDSQKDCCSIQTVKLGLGPRPSQHLGWTEKSHQVDTEK